MGQIFSDLALTIIFSLLCSLVVAIVLVPVLSSKYLRIDKLADRGEGVRFEINRRFTRFFSHLDDVYARGVKFVLHRRKLCIFSLIALFVLSVAAVKFIGFIFMPEPASNTVAVKFELPKGTRLEVTDDTLRGFQTTAAQELKGVKH